MDKDWNPSWPAEWQRHYAALRELVRDEEGPAEVLPGFTVHGMDIGKWLARQRKPEMWAALADGQHERLEAVGVTPLPPDQGALAKAPKAASGAFERDVAALAQYKTRGVGHEPEEPPRDTHGGQTRRTRQPRTQVDTQGIRKMTLSFLGRIAGTAGR